MAKNDIPELSFEQILLDELPEEDKQEILNRQGTSEKIKELESSNKAILISYPPSALADKIEKRLNKKKTTFFKFAPKLLTAAAALAIAAVAILDPTLPGNQSPAISNEGINLKGTPKLEIYKAGYDYGRPDAYKLETGSKLSQGDNIQISYIAAGRKYGVIFSIDGNGYVQLHHPNSEFSQPVLQTSKRTNLPYSIILDDAPYFEKYFFITSTQNFSTDAVLEEAKNLAENPPRALNENLKLPEGFDQYTIVFYKEDK